MPYSRVSTIGRMSGPTAGSGGGSRYYYPNGPTGGRVDRLAPTGGGGGMNTGALMQTFLNQQAAQRQASLAQYRNLMNTVRNTRQGVLGGIKNMGQSALADVAMNEQRAMGDAEQDLISRGLGNTTIRTSALRGVADDAQRSRERIMEQTNLARSNALMQTGQMKGDAILSRVNEGPDLSLFLQLIQQLAGSLGR